jgi:hypothetical protein
MTEKDDGLVVAYAAQRRSIPFVYANGRTCIGHVVRVEAYKADQRRPDPFGAAAPMARC